MKYIKSTKNTLLFGLIGSLVVLAGCGSVEPVRYVEPDDPLTGYFQIDLPAENTSPRTLIPVLKIDGVYYSVCRGLEVPLREGSGGLEWMLEPSSMTGTTIGRRSDGTIFIIIRDSQAEMFMSETSSPHDTGPRPMTRIEKPSWLPDVAAASPDKNDDFVGYYQPLWFPYYRIEIRKENGQFIYSALICDDNGQWITREGPSLLVPLANELGLVYSNRQQKTITCYNTNLQRYEAVITDAKMKLRMPLVRVEPTDPPAGLIPIGIPTWH